MAPTFRPFSGPALRRAAQLTLLAALATSNSGRSFDSTLGTPAAPAQAPAQAPVQAPLGTSPLMLLIAAMRTSADGCCRSASASFRACGLG